MELPEAAFEGIAITWNGRLTDVNSWFAKMVVWSVSQIVGKDISEFVASESAE